MEGFLTAAVVVVGVIAAVDLLLTLGVIRRLREHTELIGSGGGRSSAPTMVEPGRSITTKRISPASDFLSTRISSR